MPIVCALKPKNCKYLAIDLSEEMLKRSLNRMKKIESDFHSCLNGPEEGKNPQEIGAKEFENSNVSFKLMNNVNFLKKLIKLNHKIKFICID